MTDQGRNLYPQYLYAITFFNEELDRLNISAHLRNACRLTACSETEFPSWWAGVSQDASLKARWLARLADPAAAMIEERARIKNTLSFNAKTLQAA